MIVFVDIDSVCADIDTVWRELYNKDYNDNLQYEDIKSWDTHLYVKPECGVKIYDYLKDPRLYDHILPIAGAQQGVEALRTLGYRVVFPTSTPMEAAGRKYYWLKQHGFIDSDKNYIEIRDKSLLRGDYMLDDNYDTIVAFHGIGYLYTHPWNRDYYWRRRVDNWKEFIHEMTQNSYT